MLLTAAGPCRAADDEEVRRLREELAERDRAIADLRRRVEALERAVGRTQAPAAPLAATPRPVRPADEEETDEELAARALERSLVERGALLLPAWTAEIVPQVSYSHAGIDTFIVTADGRAGQRVRTDRLTGALTLRLGLPFDLQASAQLPVSYARREIVEGTSNARDVEETGPGDIQLSVTHQLLAESARWPGVTVSASWRAPTGDDAFGEREELSLGAGFHGLGAGVTLLKTLDPVVFVGSLSYSANLPDDKPVGRVDPGDGWGYSLGMSLAISPEVSLSLQLAQSFLDETELDGRELAGTDATSAVLQVGVGAVITPRTFVSVAAGIGLTSDSPDIQLSIALPLRF